MHDEPEDATAGPPAGGIDPRATDADRARARAAAEDAGRAARRTVPRRSIGRWDPATRRRTALQVLRDQHVHRVPELLPIRYGRMAASPWTYLRGAAAVMATDLMARPDTGLEVQLCGDAHVLNFGLWATPERTLAFDVRDFDETLRGPFEWDLLRLATSVVVLAEDSGLGSDVGSAAARAATTGYRLAMAEYAGMSELDVWYDRTCSEELLSGLEPAERRRMSEWVGRKAAARTSVGAYERLTDEIDGRTRIVDDPPFRSHLDDGYQRNLLAHVVESYLSTQPEHVRHLLRRFRVTDVVRQVVGVGSVGMRVYLLLAEGRSGSAPLFMQIKQAGPSVYEAAGRTGPHGNHGQRVVAGQRLMQSAPDLFIGWTAVDNAHFYVRQFRDMKVIPDSKRIGPHLAEFAFACGRCLARAHARSGDPLAVASYVGKGAAFAEGVTDFAVAYAAQTVSDHAELVAAIDAGTVAAAPS
jgi:uncharacterized protein (DUF2252 family)